MPTSTVRLSWQRRTRVPDEPGRLEPDQALDAPVRLVAGDNLAVLRALTGELRGRVTLAYLDPPFFTGKAHAYVARRRDPRTGQIRRKASPAFDDRWEDLGAYLECLAPRLELAFSTLSEAGCLVLHVDPKTSHYLKVLCDELFGPERFASEIIWRYRRWPAKTQNFQRVHDVLLRYTKSADGGSTFHQLYEPLAASTVKTWGTRTQRAVVDPQGRRLRSSTTQSQSPGAPLGDVWELGIVAPVSRERTGYPTQKPEALLERLIRSLTSPGDLLLDPFAGSGTSLIAAARLGRRSVGIDQSPQALQVTRERLARAGVATSEQVYCSGSDQSLAS